MNYVLFKTITNNLIFYKITVTDLIAISKIVINIKPFDTIPIPGGSGDGEEDGFLLVFVVLIPECISPRAGGGCRAQGMLNTQEPARL